MTVLVMATGALSFWLRAWVVSAVILLLFTFNFYTSQFNSAYVYPAYGLDYKVEPSPYNLNTINAMSTDQKVQESKSYWLEMLENWKGQTGEENQE